MEKIEDIVADMRYGMMPKHRHDHELLMKFADRIEASVKVLIEDRDSWRQLALAEGARANAATGEKSSQVGNAAKMREALVQCELFLGNVSRHGHPTLNPGDKCTACDGADELRGMVARALSAPARNCDLYATELERRTAFIDWCNETFDLKGSKDEIDTCDLKHDVDGIVHEYIDWPFAEAKGER
jgi:hypothetical protein